MEVLQNTTETSNWRIADIPYQAQFSGPSMKDQFATSPLGMSMSLIGVGLFAGGFVSLLATKKPNVSAIVIISVGFPLFLLGALINNRAKRRDWVRIEATCIDREYMRIAVNRGKTWRFRLLCKFKLDGKEYTVTPFYYSSFASEKRLLQFFSEAISSQQTCRLWVNPRNPLETEISAGGAPDSLLH